VLAELGPGAGEPVRGFLAGMIDGEARERVLRMIADADRARLRNGKRGPEHGQ
jgi:hypothetical protein